jgi:NitT/TauT family transport system substrate-binding protein
MPACPNSKRCTLPLQRARRIAPLAALILWMFMPSAWSQAAERIAVGALRFSSSGPLFLAQDRGYFRQEGLDVEIAFFEAAPTIATAVLSGSLTFGVTALTAAFYNLAADSGLRIIAGQAREEKGRSGNLVLVSKRAFDAGYTSIATLLDQPFGLTQFGSPSHYQLGQLTQQLGGPAKGTPIVAFQTLPNLVAGIRTGKVAWAIIAPPVATDLVDSGEMVVLSRYSDHGSYQFGVVFGKAAMLDTRPDVVRRFVMGYKKGLRDYSVLNNPTADEAEAEATARIVARYVYPGEPLDIGAAKIRKSALYVDPTGEVDVEDIARQIAWYQQEGMVRRPLEAGGILRMQFLREAH